MEQLHGYPLVPLPGLSCSVTGGLNFLHLGGNPFAIVAAEDRNNRKWIYFENKLLK